MIRYDLINPSDPYTFKAPDHEIASVVACLLGNGKYPAEPLDGAAKTLRVPCFLFGGHDEWFTETFGCTFEESVKRCLDGRAEELAACFESVTLGSKRRTSMNDIGGAAKSLAQGVRLHKAKAAGVSHE